MKEDNVEVLDDIIDEKDNSFEEPIITGLADTKEISISDLRDKTIELDKETLSEVVNDNVIDIEDVNSNTDSDIKRGNKRRNIVRKVIISLILLVLIGGCGYYYFFTINNTNEVSKRIDNRIKEAPYRINDNSLQDFDLYFLKLENVDKNKVYSPLSIKYALQMLSDGANGNTKREIDNILGKYNVKKYTNNNHMSFANGMFIRDRYKDSVIDNYTDMLKDNYNAEVIIDDFSTPNNINNWVSKKTFKLTNNLFDDVSDNDFLLVNSLAINMNWKNQIHCTVGNTVPCYVNNVYSIRYEHEKLEDNASTAYSRVSVPYDSESSFYGNGNNSLQFGEYKDTKRSEIFADFNRYNIVEKLGEDKIKDKVRGEYTAWLESEEGKKLVESGVADTDVENYLSGFIKDLRENYGKNAANTDFMLYNDKDVKVFAKDLEEYDNITLQYIGIMPTSKDLKTYIEDINSEDVNKIIKNLKEVKIDNFKEGVVTQITGSVPLFKYDYKLELMRDLKKLGIKDVFDKERADLDKMVDGSAYINKAVHETNIEFSNDGIKAAAATSVGGLGSTGGGFDYLFNVPVEKIDLTFNKPYMYIIRDKNSGEVWFAGTVYEPIHR